MEFATKKKIEAKLKKMVSLNMKEPIEQKQEHAHPVTMGNVIRRRKGEPSKRITKKYKSITRMDVPAKKTHGWNVRVFFKGKMHFPKFFSDKLYNGTENALDEAIYYRNTIEEKIGKPRTERVVVSQNPFNRTDMIGVRRIKKQTGGFSKDGKPNYSDVYEVTWCPRPNITRRTSVSIRAHGEEEAFKRACAIREEKEKEIYEDTVYQNS